MSEERGFREWYAKNGGKPSSSVLYSPKYNDHREKYRSRENLKSAEKENVEVARSNDTEDENFVSLRNPVPTQKDYEELDAERQFRHYAREVREAQRAEQSEKFRKCTAPPLHQTPVKDETHRRNVGFHSPLVNTSNGSPSNELFFTPQHGSGETDSSSNDISYSTPMTSATKSMKNDSFDSQKTKTPSSLMKGSYLDLSSFDQRRIQISLSEEKMNKNFEKMAQIFDKTSNSRSTAGKAERNLTQKLKMAEKKDSNSSVSSQFSVLEEFAQEPRPEGVNSSRSSENGSKEFPIMTTPKITKKPQHKHKRDIGYVEALCHSMEMHRNYERNAIMIEEKMAKIDELKNFMESSLTKSISEESSTVMEKKAKKVAELKGKYEKTIEIKKMIHEMQSRKPFEMDIVDVKYLQLIGTLCDLPKNEFILLTKSLQEDFSKNFQMEIQKFRVVADRKKERKHRGNTKRPSEAMKIAPSEASFAETSTNSTRNEPRASTSCDANTQTTSRLEKNDRLSHTSPREIGIERLDLSALEQPVTQQPKEVKNIEELDILLKSIVLRSDKSLDDVEAKEANASSSGDNAIASENLNSSMKSDSGRFDAVYPQRPPSSAELTPKSSRASIDSATAQRLSAGISHFLEAYRRNEEINEKVVETSPNDTNIAAKNDEAVRIVLQIKENMSPGKGRIVEIDKVDEKKVEEINDDDQVQSIQTERKEEIVPPIFEYAPETSVNIPEENVSEDVGNFNEILVKFQEDKVHISEVQSKPIERIDPEHVGIEDNFCDIQEGLKNDPQVKDEFKDAEENAAENASESHVPEENLYDEMSNNSPTIFDFDEGDETKKFAIKDEYENDFLSMSDDSENKIAQPSTTSDSTKSDEKSVTDGSFNDSADDSGFLLNDKPIPKLKSIFDTPQKIQNNIFTADTPRVLSPESDNIDEEDEDEGIDWLTHCCTEIVPEVAAVMIEKVSKSYEELEGLDWLTAQEKFPMTSFSEIKTDYVDVFQILDSMLITVWGTIVEFLNKKYLKLGRGLTPELEQHFKKEAVEVVKNQICDIESEDKVNEWQNDIKVSKKVMDLMIMRLDYRYDIRRQIAEEERERYRWTKIVMEGVRNRYSTTKMSAEIRHRYDEELEKISAEGENEILSMSSEADK